MTNLVSGHDNRGTEEYPFGFVYFTDGRRVCYTKDKGVVADATGGWPAITVPQEKAAESYLKQKGVLPE